jgi:hypothetical protein
VPSRHAIRRPHLLLATLVVAVATAALMVTAVPPAEAAPFEDTAGHASESAVQALVELGVLNGCTGTRFCPNWNLTRGQMATILVRALDLPPAEGTTFRDLDSSLHAANIEALAQAEITQGCGADRFCPGQSVTRGQVASLLSTAFSLPEATTRHFDDDSVHAGAIDRVAEAGITSGCAASLTSFCGSDPVLRWHTAVFVARAMGLTGTVQLASLDDRRAQQAAIDEQRRIEEEARRQAEEQARREAEAAAAAAERDRMWERLAQCESGGNWSINTGNGYYGGLQFSLSSWQWVGGSGYPHNATRAEQIRRAEILLSRQGWNAWPSCSRQLGYR